MEVFLWRPQHTARQIYTQHTLPGASYLCFPGLASAGLCFKETGLLEGANTLPFVLLYVTSIPPTSVTGHALEGTVRKCGHNISIKGQENQPKEHPAQCHSHVLSRKHAMDQCLCKNTLVRKEKSVCESLTVFDAVYLHVNLERENVAGLFLFHVLVSLQPCMCLPL